MKDMHNKYLRSFCWLTVDARLYFRNEKVLNLIVAVAVRISSAAVLHRVKMENNFTTTI